MRATVEKWPQTTFPAWYDVKRYSRKEGEAMVPPGRQSGQDETATHRISE